MRKGVKRTYSDLRPQCDAKAKSSQKRCEYPSVEGKTVCRFHGGNTPMKSGGKYSKYKKTLPTLVSQRKKIDANPRLVSSEEFLKKYATIINQLYENLELTPDEPCLLCGASGGNLLDNPALKPLLDNLAVATQKAAAVEELKMKKGYYKSLTEITDWLQKSLLPQIEDLLKPGKLVVLQKRLLQIEDKT